ncbi:MAG: two-component regulator propeller domain-containing protein [Pseudomonadota bacterium]
MCLVLCVCTLQAFGQSRPGLVTFRRVALPEDVPAHLSAALAQDARGFLWIGTQDGLVRYDGYSFKVFRPKAGDPTSLGGSYVRSLLVARDGRLWIGTVSGGVAVFDPRTDRFTQYRHAPAKPASLAHDRVEALAEDRGGGIWIGTDDGLDRLDPVSGAIRHYRHGANDPSSLANDQVRSLLFDREGRLWVGTRAALQMWQRGGGFVRVASDAADPQSLNGEQISKLFQDSRGRIWIGTVTHGAAVYDPKDGQLRRLRPAQGGGEGLSHYWIYGFAEAVPGEVWIATFGGGVDVVDSRSLAVIDRLRYDSASDSSIGADRVGAILVDRAGLVWVGSWGGGLARHDPSTRAFRKLHHLAANPDSPSHPSVVRTLETADGMLWLGTNGNGIDILNGEGHVRTSYRPNPAQAGALADGSISCMAQAENGTIWVATLDGTLHRMRPGQKGFERFDRKRGLPGGPIRTMVFGADGALWAGSLNGLARIDAASDQITVFAHRDDDVSSLSGREVESLAFTADGTLWAGTENGLNAFDTKSGKAVRIMRDPARSDSLPDIWVPDLMVARDGKLWVATQSGVAILRKWDGRVAHFDVLNTRLNLPSRPAESLIEDAQGKVWLGSAIRIDPLTWHYRSFGPADGNEFRTLYIASRVRTRRGELVFGSPEGLLIVRPDQLEHWTYRPPLAVSAITVDGEEQAGAAGMSELALQPNQRNLRLEFAALDLSAPAKLNYRYRLEGYDADWVSVDANQRVAAYTGLPPGQYRLRIQGSNREGIWSPQEWHMALTVVPALHQRWWFRAAIWLFGAALVIAVFRLRLRQLRRRAAQLERTVSERTAALASAYRRIEEGNLSDPLTGLHNRRYLEQALAADLAQVDLRHSQSAVPPASSDLVVLLVDLDHFKQVKEQYGQAGGDAVLAQTAQLLKQCMRESDHVVCAGEGEFLLVARFVDREQGPLLAEKIRSAVAAQGFALPDGSLVRKTVSIGFTAYPFARGLPTPMELDTLQHVAECALGAAKRSWRDGWLGVESRGCSGAAVEQSLRDFLGDPGAAVAAGAVEPIVDSAHAGTVRWQT